MLFYNPEDIDLYIDESNTESYSYNEEIGELQYSVKSIEQGDAHYVQDGWQHCWYGNVKPYGHWEY